MAERAGAEAHQEKSPGFVGLIADATEHNTGVNPAEAERIAHNIIKFGRASVIRYHVEIAAWIGVLVIDRWRHPLSIQRQRAERGFDCAGRSEWMRVVTL